MKLQFYYDKENPSYETYQKLIEKMRKMSDDFYSLDDVFYSKYNYDLIKNYEKHKMIIINKMFKEIISYFPNLKTEACAIYLNGSYARGNITAGSDVDLTFYFDKKDVSKYQSTIYLIRYAIATMLKVNVVHVHSFTKNFITEYRKMNNLIISDVELKTKIIWLSTNEHFNISYPKNQMIAEREVCEISSIKDLDSLKKIYNKQLEKLHPKEWIYTHKPIYITNNSFSIDKIINTLDATYNKEQRAKSLINIKKEIYCLIENIDKYYNELKISDTINLANYNMIGKRKVCMMVHSFVTYLRWYYIDNNLENVPTTLNLDELFNYKYSIVNNTIIDNVNKSYCYFRFLISRVEIWAKKYNHHFEHRSNEIIEKKEIITEYKNLWHNDYCPIDEQVDSYNNLVYSIKYALKVLK